MKFDDDRGLKWLNIISLACVWGIQLGMEWGQQVHEQGWGCRGTRGDHLPTQLQGAFAEGTCPHCWAVAGLYGSAIAKSF